ncbi:MAG: deoxyribodipyrimidine photolyase [Sphingomonadales bacterium]|nr:MAG: deoxyribodipyrimidine photolyase [Sphingomonadales bacterium]
MAQWEPTRAAALARADAFAPNMGSAYAARRNYDIGLDADTVSALSPWLRRRLITERELIEMALAGHGPDAAKFVSEVLWRGYFKGWLEQRPEIWERYVAGLGAAQSAVAQDAALVDRLAAAEAGRTGIDCFDAWIAQLRTHGWLHNHARMWFASIWIFTLRLPWQLGADLFLRELVDGDAASNTLSWRWVAGLHTRGKHYLARAENIRRYTEGRFDPHGLDEEGEPLPFDGDVPMTPPARGDAMPTGPYALVIHADDSGFDALELQPPARVIGVSAHGLYGASAAARAFVEGAVADAAARAGAIYGCPVELVPDWPEPSDLALVAPWLTVGPLRDSVPDGYPLAQLRNPYDAALWPLATAGFFKVKSRAAAALAPLGIVIPEL